MREIQLDTYEEATTLSPIMKPFYNLRDKI